MDSIEGAKIDTDEDGFHLILTGDFVDACEKYLDTEDLTELELRIPVYVMFVLGKDIGKYDDNWR